VWILKGEWRTMIEVGSMIVASGLVVGISYYKLKGMGRGTNDADKIQKIFLNAGMNRRGQTFDLQRKRRNKEKSYTEYVYRIPLGLSYKQDILPNKARFEDGINVNSLHYNFTLKDVLALRPNKTIIKQIKELLKKERKRKEVSFDYDGCLKIKVYDEPLTDSFIYEDGLKKGKWVIPIGLSEDREVIYFDFDEHYQLIVAGAPGFGKTEFMKMIITLLTEQNPDDVTFHLIDLKEGIGFNRFKQLKQVKTVGETPEQGLEIMRNLQDDMTSVLKKVKESNKDNVKDAKIKRRHFIIIDEGAQIAADKEGAKMLEDICRRGRAAGVYVIYSTQYPTNQTLPSQVRQMSNARLCYRLKTDTASMAVLDEVGAESLPDNIKGRAIFQITSSKVVQTIHMKNEVIEEKIKIHFRGEKDERNDNKDKTSGKHPLQLTKTRLSN
jgi:S-DNA-T family DNA segregation ATPase FtsK/SpoIIIE